MKFENWFQVKVKSLKLNSISNKMIRQTQRHLNFNQ
jgi:hypothetical protein